MPMLGTFGAGSVGSYGRRARAAVATAGIFNLDNNSANLWTAVPLTTYRSASTGGGVVDVSPQIRGNTAGQTPGTAKTYNAGSATITSGAPFTHYGDALAFPSSYSSTSQLTYTNTTLGSNQALTVECRMYVPNNSTYPAVVNTNNFSGGFYCCWGVGVGFPGYQTLNHFSNYGSPSGRQVTSVGSVNLNAWNHLAFVFNGSTNLKMFINGTLGYDGDYGENSSGAGPTTIGPTYWDGYGNNNGAKMVDYRIYTGVQKYTSSFTVSDTDPNFGGPILAAA